MACSQRGYHDIILHMKSRRIKIIGWLLGGQLLLWGILLGAQNVYADLESADVFQDSQWGLLIEYGLVGAESLQSICVTDQYIVCLINTSSEESTPDKLIAFYKNDRDENGDPVKQYSYAKTVSDMDYEHGNGMTYNPETDEIVIAGGIPLKEENFGCLFVLDAKTLQCKRKIQISPEWRPRAVAYCEDKSCYLVQTCSLGGYRFVEVDTDFRVIGGWKDGITISKGSTFQDFEVCANDIITVPFEKGKLYNGSVVVYSRNKGELLGEYQLNYSSDLSSIEAESIAELSPGQFLMGCNIPDPRRIGLYKAQLPMVYQVETSIEHGTITENARDIPYGGDSVIEYQPEENYEVSEIIVDGTAVDVKKYKKGYTFGSLSSNHFIQVKCTKIPQFKITTEAVDGEISETQMIRRGQDFVIELTPKNHYELDQLLVDQEVVKVDASAKTYTLKNVKKEHSVEARYKAIPFFPITASIKNGKISATKTNVYRDDNFTLTFSPNKDFVLKTIRVNGAKTDIKEGQKKLTLLNVQQAHEVEVIYQWKYMVYLYIALAGAVAMLSGYLFLTIRRYKNKKKSRQLRQEYLKKDETQVR